MSAFLVDLLFGQYEVITGPLTPLEAADALIATRETIYNVASKHGLRATFAPRLYANSSKLPLLPTSSPLTPVQQPEAQRTPTSPCTNPVQTPRLPAPTTS